MNTYKNRTSKCLQIIAIADDRNITTTFALL
jgi:hypothetical protein